MKTLKKYQLLLLSIAGGLLFSLSWPQNGAASILFFALIPFLIVEDQIFRNKNKYSGFAVFFYTYPGFFIWNLLTTFWLYHASVVGAAMAVICYALFMAMVFQLFHYCRKILSRNHINPFETGYFVLVVFWISYEYFNLNWELSWPWLQLGNGFASALKTIQWYEYTGVLGGTLWILVLNIMIFRLLQMFLEKKPEQQLRRFSLVLLSILIIPIIVSLAIYYNYSEKSNPVNVVVIQPNVDPYGEKFIPEFREEIWDKLLGQTILTADHSTDFIVWPETSIPGSVGINVPEIPQAIIRITDSIRQFFPQAVLVTGADAYEIYEERKTPTARYFNDGDCCWDSYNTALEIDSSGQRNYYHKSKLVPGVERMPYPKFFRFLEKYTIDLGGTSGSMGTSPEPFVFSSGKVPVAPVICYESVYGEYVNGYVRKGAQLIFIVTNDGWWGDTPGYKQHFSYASLRAIETRRSIARSANTGISGYINQRGDVLKAVPYWEQHALNHTLNANDQLTVYVKYGDYIGRISAFASLAIAIIVILRRITRSKITKR
jgi:apolipoprotein N-acyltransferase